MSLVLRAVDPMIHELERESATTRRVLTRVPDEHLGFRPHPKSMNLGQLAFHVAGIPGSVSGFLETDAFDVSQANFEPPMPESAVQILSHFEESLGLARARLAALDDDRAAAPWRLTKEGNVVMEMPKIVVMRTILFNHLYHHRGQLGVYLRLLDVAVPAIYGRSADEMPF